MGVKLSHLERCFTERIELHQRVHETITGVTPIKCKKIGLILKISLSFLSEAKKKITCTANLLEGFIIMSWIMSL